MIARGLQEYVNTGNIFNLAKLHKISKTIPL
jgi:hypothetical protein